MILGRKKDEALLAEIKALKWFHQIDFGNGVRSPGWIKASKIRRQSKLMFDFPIQGKSVLDIGCWDGAYSIEAKRRGAARVLATDHFAWAPGSWGDRRAFELARQRLAPDIEVMDVEVEDLTTDRVGNFDVVLFCGVFYHLRHPFQILERIASLAKQTLIVESRMLRTFHNSPVMRFYPGTELDGDPTNWWAPNRACLDAMLRDLGFSNIRFRRPDYRGRRGLFHADR